MSGWDEQLDTLSERLTALRDDSEDSRRSNEALRDILHEVCDVVRAASTQGPVEAEEVLVKAEDVINQGIQIAYGSGTEGGLCDFMLSFAHGGEETLVKDKLGTGLGQGTLHVFFEIFGDWFDHVRATSTRPVPNALKARDPWNPALQPHPKSTRLARFRQDVITSYTAATPLAQTVYQARCEITDTSISSPSRMLISPGQGCLAIIGAGGWKNRDPTLHCFLLDDADHLEKDKCFSPGLAQLMYTMVLDDERKLIFVGDADRVKSYSWEVDPDMRANIFSRAGLSPVHTLDSDECDGWLTLLPNGRVVRAGLGKAFVWNIDDLEQHGPENKRIGEERYNTEDSWRDNDDGTSIEDSLGSAHHATITFADPTFHPAVWHRHTPTGNMLCGTSGQKDGKYTCASLDLEHGGKIVSRYLGHGGDVEDISTSEGDAHTFATAGADGYARLYDVRQPLPVLTFDHGYQMEYCPAVVLVHPDGIPTLFSAGVRSEHIKMWDIRAREAVYELATGNNAVVSMAWDARHSALYAATECRYMDSMGLNHGYRAARIPRWADEFPEDNEDGDGDNEDGEDLGDEEDEEEEDDLDRCWPQRAHHGESYFGYAFDAGEHRLYRYSFKEDPDPKQLPPYGQASMHQSGW